MKSLSNLLLLSLLSILKSASSVRIHYIHWNSSSPIFRDPSSSHVIEIRGGRRDQPWDYEQANIICPFYRGDISATNLTERYVVYNVTRQEFESCRLNNHNNVESGVPTPKIVALCDRPFQPNYFTLTFRPFSPTPGAFEFQPGNDYYFMSTSSQKNIYQKNGGRCRTHNMRLVFRIRDVDLKDDFRSVEHRTSFDVAQPRSDDSDEDDGDYDDDEEDEAVENVDFRTTEKETAYPVLSNANRCHVIDVFKIAFVAVLISHRLVF